MPSIYKLVKEKDMSKKTLLEEGTIRRFMKLAEMGPIGDSFVSNMFNEEEEPTPEEAEYDEAEFDAGELEGELEGEDEMLDVDDDVLDDEVEDVEAGVDGELTLTDEEAEAFLAVADRIRAALEGGEAPEELPAPDMGVEDEGEELEVDDVEFDTGEEELDLDASEGDETKTHKGEEDYTTKKGRKKKTSGKKRGAKKGDEAYVNESLVNQILQRVAKRLTNKKR